MQDKTVIGVAAIAAVTLLSAWFGWLGYDTAVYGGGLAVILAVAQWAYAKRRE